MASFCETAQKNRFFAKKRFAQANLFSDSAYFFVTITS